MRRKAIVEDIRASAHSSPEQHMPKPLVGTGSTLLNLACSDRAQGGFQLGSMVNLIGDSSSGKTFLALTLLAEAAHHKDYQDYDLFYDDSENRNNFNIKYLFGDKVADKIQPAFGKNKDDYPINSITIEDFQDSIYKKLQTGRPFIYILDSMDALDAEADVDKYEKVLETREKIREGKDVKPVAGTYGMAKAKANSEILRRICGKLRNTNSLLIIISQTRDNIGIGFADKTRAGGRALRFYACHEIWMAVVETYKKQGIPIGVCSKLKIKKNSLTGKVREVSINIYYDYGIDDIGGMIDYLVDNKIWIKEKQTIKAEGIDFAGTRESIIAHVEKNNLQRQLQRAVQKGWKSVEESLKSNRKRKYENI